ncbi:hypothetical protein [Nocardia sp. NPDC050710]|uniref:hypothetical protein n=1 Tax=Nocardia sp. NPDC050710 TaxID=3157220 RepID=UPI003405E65C
MNNSQIRRLGVSIIGFAAVAAAVLPAAPAQAKVLDLSISGTTHQVGVRYTLSAHCDFTSSVIFTDNGAVIQDFTDMGGIPITSYPDANGVAKIRWTPRSAGAHMVAAQGCSNHTQTDTPVEIVVEVTGG